MKKAKILEMNDELFKFRRRIMKMVYEVRKIIGDDLPWIKVRVVDYGPDCRTLGTCYINKNFITICKTLAKSDDEYLYHVVAHELMHAYKNAKHDEKCPLMCPLVPNDTTKAKVNRVLKSKYKKMATTAPRKPRKRGTELRVAV